MTMITTGYHTCQLGSDGRFRWMVQMVQVVQRDMMTTMTMGYHTARGYSLSASASYSFTQSESVNTCQITTKAAPNQSNDCKL